MTSQNIIDGRSISSGTEIEMDLCIIGAGPVGITLALELQNTPLRICLVESGSFEKNPQYDSLDNAKYSGESYDLNESRARGIGGTTSKWFGLCRPLDSLDFEKRDWMPYSGWPFGKAELEPFYKRAGVMCRLPDPNFEVSYWEQKTQLPLLKFSDPRVQYKIIQQPSPVPNFGVVYEVSLEKASNLKMFINSTVVNLSTDTEGRKISSVDITTFSHNRFSIKSKWFILAGGGIENPRLLLTSRKRYKNGLGNGNDLVGRFFMEHPHFRESGLATVDPSNENIDLYSYYPLDGFNVKTLLGTTPDAQKSFGLANYMCFYDPKKIVPQDPAFTWVSSLEKTISIFDGLSTINEKNVFPVLHMQQEEVEQFPNPDSRVTLIDDKDPFGVPRVNLNWQLTERDHISYQKSREILAAAFGLSRLGRVELRKRSLGWGRHHMGTTRMHLDPKQGVVDSNCKVHGLDNLYIGGSSVFPTGGCSNPTLTIIALTIRLAEYFKEIIK